MEESTGLRKAIEATMLAKLFVYGQLQPQYYPPKTMHSHTPAVIHGDLYSISSPGSKGKVDAAAVRIGTSKNEIRGYVLVIDAAELPKLDAMERPEYTRISTRTLTGMHVFVYEYTGKIPAGTKRIDGWRMP